MQIRFLQMEKKLHKQNPESSSQMGYIPIQKNALGFFTHDQYMAIYYYLKFRTIFIDLLDKQNYQKSLLNIKRKKVKRNFRTF